MTNELEAKSNKPKPPVFKAVNGEILIDTKDPNFSNEQAQKMLVGVTGEDVFNKLLNQACSSCRTGDYNAKINSILPILLDIAPKDSLEGLLAVQMVATHNMAMETAGRAMLKDQTFEGVEMNLNRSAKLMRTFSAQLETLQKYRNKGKQTIQVQHVTVQDGGQAIVGNVAGGEG